MILERANLVSSWFDTFPIHRQLNSINRRFTRSKSRAHNMRHDHNSLLGSTVSKGLFGAWSSSYWPAADDLVAYINHFAEPQLKAGKIRLQQNVTKVAKCSAEPECRYLVSVQDLKESGALTQAPPISQPRRHRILPTALLCLDISYWDVTAKKRL